jgi:hypothetical protein
VRISGKSRVIGKSSFFACKLGMTNLTEDPISLHLCNNRTGKSAGATQPSYARQSPQAVTAPATDKTLLKWGGSFALRAQDFACRLGRSPEHAKRAPRPPINARQSASTCQPHIPRVTLFKLLEGQDLEIGVHQLQC